MQRQVINASAACFCEPTFYADLLGTSVSCQLDEGISVFRKPRGPTEKKPFEKLNYIPYELSREPLLIYRQAESEA